MTTPTNENRDSQRTHRDEQDGRFEKPESEPRQRLDLSVTKIAAGAGAAALAAAVGSKLGVAGTIAGAAVASVVSTSASTVIGHSLERGKTAARKAMPVLDPEQLETAILSRARAARADRVERADRADRADRAEMTGRTVPAQTRAEEPVALTRVDETAAKPSLADRALTDIGLDETVVHDVQTVVLPPVTPLAAPRTWKDRIPGRKPLIAAAVASFMLGTGAVTALEVARKGEFPGYHSNVFSNDPGQSGGARDQPTQQNSGGSSTHQGSTPSQKANSSSPASSGSSSSAPSTTPSTPATSDSAPNTPTAASTSPSAGPTTPSTAPTSAPTGTPDPTTGASTPGPTAPSATATGLGKATPTGGASSG